MPNLEFKGKEFVFNHHLAIPYRPLATDAKKSIGKADVDGNLIIHGDNLLALKALLPRYAGSVDVVYIDSPYNTGKESWRYNDNVNSPAIQEWLKSNPVNSEDMLRHDKWLALMFPRLRLLQQLLAKDGVIFASIDDNELHHLRCAFDEILGEANWVGTIVWKNVTDNNPTNIASEHEYILCYAKDKTLLDKEWKSSLSEIKIRLVKIGEEFVEKYHKQTDRQAAYTEWFRENKHQLGPLDRYKYIDKGGIYTGSQSVHNPGREGYRYDVIHPVTKKPCKEPLMGYRFPLDTMKALLAEKRILFGDDETKIIELKVYAHEYEEKLPSVIELDGRVGAYELRELFPEKTKVFDNPKPVELISQLLGFTTKKNSLVLDSFAGSGTTAHAVLALNAQDGGNRRFILVECEDYADELTAERVRRVIEGVAKSKNEAIKKGTGGSFTFCTLGEELNLDKILQGKQLPDFRTLGQWLFHTATGDALAANSIEEKKQYLGVSNGRHVWLIYKPDLEFLQSPASALTRDVAKAIAAAKPGASNLVFGPAKFISNKELAAIGVEFVPLPFALYRVAKD